MNILQTIAASKRIEVAQNKELIPIKLLERSPYFGSKTVSLSKYLQRSDKHGIIAEFKRKSPSKGFINEFANAAEITTGYMQSGASALSVLTDTKFFGGSSKDLTDARKHNFCPILRKDFILEEYQIIEAKSIGADAILLIAALLQPNEIKLLASFAKSLGLEILLEIHSKNELNAICPEIDVVGVNNRNLETFEVSLQNSINLAPKLAGLLTVSESGIKSAADIISLKQVGYTGFLIGKMFMQTASPETACKNLIQKIIEAENKLKHTQYA